MGHCTDPGCYSRSVNYFATARQMVALADLSDECHQSLNVRYIYIYLFYPIDYFKRCTSLFFPCSDFFFYLFGLSVQLHFRATGSKRRCLFLVERQEWSTAIFLVRKYHGYPHLSVWHRPELCRVFHAVQLRFWFANSIIR